MKSGYNWQGPVAFEEMFELSFYESHGSNLTSSTHKSSCTHYDNSNYRFLGQNLQSFS